MNSNILTVYAGCFIATLACFHYFKLYKEYKYIVYIKLFVASNVIFTIYLIFVQIYNHTEEIVNTNTEFYAKIMSALFDDTLKIFRENPKMKYFYDDLFNNNNPDANANANANNANANYNEAYSNSYSHPHEMHRDKMMEQNITYSIMSALANYSVFYYSHVELDAYKDLVMAQRGRVLKIVAQFLKSNSFKENVEKGLNDFAGLNLTHFFKEFFNVVPSNQTNHTRERLRAMHAF